MDSQAEEFAWFLGGSAEVDITPPRGVQLAGDVGRFRPADLLVEPLYAKAQQLWSFSETRTPAESRDYHAYALGWMYRNNDLTAAFGRAQLTKLDKYLTQTRINAQRYCDSHTGMTEPLRSPNGPEVTEFMAAGIRKAMENVDQLED